ncbi:2-hydroxy-6-oxononadienedioate/2-hydroxy-6-oxononatrienedioate hydrolase 1-like [Lolium rigidum]|uniref:2-hydroxy-6-oxononadienedioate/2-hydroxy-6- oxononatrienedioate hydrolase 1-like n=1 Tax=Lolium rigidum TaxID=89674 RepID=UPI001F5C48E7|nr:2-hydroxy-6-oxononadienedioate/2-hydroxy-6-oxononatrienedioate hydrolase 1-like [Lolium rigidum]
MPSSTLGIAPLLDAYFRRRFSAAGLVQETVPLDGGATTVHCWRFPPGAASEEDLPVLVLLHGFGPPATWQWFRQVGALSRRFRLVVPNLLFFGGSRTSDKERSEARQAEAVAGLIRAVVPAGARVSVVGTSYGGFVAYHVARLLGADAVERVVIASSDLLKGDADDRALLRRGGADRVEDVMLPRTPEKMRRLMELAYHRPRRFAPGFVLRDLIQYLYTDNIEEKKELIQAITLGDKDKFQLTPLPQQVLVLWGENDQIFPIEKAFQVTRQLGATARLEILKNTGHMPQEEDAKRFNEALLNFLLPAPISSL